MSELQLYVYLSGFVAFFLGCFFYYQSRKENLSEAEIQEITKIYDEIISLSKDRNFKNNLDLNFLKKEIIKA